jgi:hypothetical protein
MRRRAAGEQGDPGAGASPASAARVDLILNHDSSVLVASCLDRDPFVRNELSLSYLDHQFARSENRHVPPPPDFTEISVGK